MKDKLYRMLKNSILLKNINKRRQWKKREIWKESSVTFKNEKKCYKIRMFFEIRSHSLKQSECKGATETEDMKKLKPEN